ncbi:homeobox domain-containing protein, partial [Leucosporidium creatinivorum]
KHRRRTSPNQLKILEYHFEHNPKPDVTLRKALSEQLDMTPREVQVWFQNRRAKTKK